MKTAVMYICVGGAYIKIGGHQGVEYTDAHYPKWRIKRQLAEFMKMLGRDKWVERVIINTKLQVDADGCR